MRRYLGAVLALALLASAGCADDTKKQLELIQGEWTLVSLTNDGRKFPGEDVNKVIIEGNKMTVVLKNPDGKEERKSVKLTLIPNKTPKAIDFVAEDGPRKDENMPGIYELKGDSLKFCSADPPKSKERPTEFSSKEGSGQVLWELKRIKK